MSIKKFVVAISLGLNLLCFPLAHAEVQIYEGTGEYVMSDFETPDIAKQRAKSRAEQSAAEQAGVYVKSYTRTANSVVTEDEIVTIANTIIKITDEKYTVTPVSESGGSFLIVANIRATVDSSRIDEWLARDRQQNRELVEQNKRLLEEKAKQDAEIADLRKKLDAAKSTQEKKNIEKNIIGEDRKFLSNQKFEEGRRLWYEKKYWEAAAAFSQAIGLNENNAMAYNGRGSTYNEQGNYSQAIADFNKAIEFDPKYAIAYINRGFAYRKQGNYSQTIADCSRAIELDPKCAPAYSSRAAAYHDQGNYSQAIADYSRAIELDPKYVPAYNNRGVAYSDQGNYSQAITDYSRAIELDPKNAMAYRNRSICYEALGNHRQANADFAKAKALGYKE